MKGFKEFVKEAFDKPLDWKWLQKPTPLKDTRRAKRSEFKLQAQFIAGGEKYLVEITSLPGESHWEVGFFPVNKRPEENVGLVVLTTVLDVIKDFVKIMDPEMIVFKAEKDHFSGDGMDRPRIYKKLVNKFLPFDRSAITKEKSDSVIIGIRKK